MTDIEDDNEFKKFKEDYLNQNKPKKGKPTPCSKKKANYEAKVIRSRYNLTPKQLKVRARNKRGKKTRKMNRKKK